MRASSALVRRTSASAVAALLVTGLAACGSGGGNDSPLAAGSTSTAATSSATSSTTATSTTAASSPAAGSSAPEVSAGSTLSASDMAAIIKSGVSSIGTAHETLTMNTAASGTAVQMHAEADVQMSPLAMSMTMTMGPTQIDEMLVDGVMYMKAPGMTPSGKWVKLDIAQMGQMMGGSGLTDALTNPLGMMDKMTGFITKATYVGPDTVSGAAAKHYRMTVDLKAAMAKLFPKLPSSATANVGPTADEDIWVDDQGRAVKTVVNFGSGSMTTLLSDFGKKVDVQAPPASQVTTAPGLGG
ncbi:MAG TPA: DUF6612 family protein [Nocardioides sp.]|nr:DUF6612 family protein [Nocardioides sp.]